MAELRGKAAGSERKALPPPPPEEGSEESKGRQPQAVTDEPWNRSTVGKRGWSLTPASLAGVPAGPLGASPGLHSARVQLNAAKEKEGAGRRVTGQSGPDEATVCPPEHGASSPTTVQGSLAPRPLPPRHNARAGAAHTARTV